MIIDWIRMNRSRGMVEIQPTELLIGACLLVSSCCSPGVKPEDANLFQAICGLGTGDFKEQSEKEQAKAAASRQALDEEKSKSQLLESDLETSKTELETLLTELDQMEQQNRRMEAKISAMKADTAEAKIEQARLLTKFEAIQRDLTALKIRAAEEQQAFEQYNSDKKRLLTEIELLEKIVGLE